MKTIKDALKELVVVFGGAENVKAVKGNKITEILKKLKEAIVSNGAADRGPLNLSFATTDPYTVDTPLSEVKAAIEAGRQVCFSNDDSRYTLTEYVVINNEIVEMYFGYEAEISYDGSWNVS